MIQSRILPFKPAFPTLDAMSDAVADLSRDINTLAVNDHQMERYQDNPVVASMRDLSHAVLEAPDDNLSHPSNALALAAELQRVTLQTATAANPMPASRVFATLAAKVLGGCDDTKLAERLLSKGCDLASGDDRWAFKCGNLLVGIADQYAPNLAVPLALAVFDTVAEATPLTEDDVKTLASLATGNEAMAADLAKTCNAIMGRPGQETFPIKA